MNAQAKHTPGPWYPSGNYVRTEPNGTGIRIAWVCGDGPQPEWIPNRNLIASAPEIAAALLALVDTTNAHCPVDHPALPLARNILRKAGLLS